MKITDTYLIKAVLSCAFCCLLNIMAYGQGERGSVTGKVRAGRNVLQGASVQLEGTPYGTVTGADGTFTLPDVPANAYTLSVSLIGFTPQKRAVAVTGGAITDIDVQLTESVQNLQEVEIIGRKETTYKNDYSFAATKTATAIKDIPQALSVVTKELLDDRQAYRLSDAIRNVSGVNNFSSGSYNDFAIRGFRSSSNTAAPGVSAARLINGMRGGYGFFTQPATINLERIEIIKGPASALFGNAVPGGTMNLVTKKPLSEKRQSLSFTAGSFNTYRAAADFTGPVNEEGTLLYRLNVGYENAQSFRNLQFNETYTVAPSVSFLPNDRTRFNVDMVYNLHNTRLDRGQAIFGATAGTDLSSTPISLSINASNDYYRVKDLSLIASLNHAFTDDFSFNVSYSKFNWNEDLLEHRHNNAYGVDSAGQAIPNLLLMQMFQRKQQTFTDNVSAYFVKEQKTGPLAHKLLVGYDYVSSVKPLGAAQNTARGYLRKDGTAGNYSVRNRNQFVLDGNGNPVPNVPFFDLTKQQYTIRNIDDYVVTADASQTPTKYEAHGVYIQDQITWNRLQVLLGLRKDYFYDYENYDITNQVRTFQEAWIPRIGVVYAVRPNINVYGTYTGGYQPQGVSALSNPNAGGPFEPMTSRMVEAGAKGEFFGKRLLGTVAFYRIDVNNVLVNANDAQNVDLQRARDERSAGVEVDLVGQLLPNFSVNLNYTYNEATISGGLESEVGLHKENAPYTMGGAWLKYTLDRGWLNGVGIGVGLNHVGKRLPSQVRDFELPAYTLLDAALYYTYAKFKLSVNLNNLANQTYWVGGYNYYAIFPGAPRNFLVNVAYTF